MNHIKLIHLINLADDPAKLSKSVQQDEYLKKTHRKWLFY